MLFGVCEVSHTPFTMKNGEYMKNIHTYEEAVTYLLDIPKFTKKNTMEDTKNFLKELNLPSEDKRIIHVAGTNGKGSVCFYLNNLLNGAGKNTGLFTSPHLVDIRERFRINGEMVSKEALSLMKDWGSLVAMFTFSRMPSLLKISPSAASLPG